MFGRLGPKLLISERSQSLASSKTRPPLLSSATRPGISGPPDCVRLLGANAHPTYGWQGFSYQFRTYSSIPGSFGRKNSKNTS